MRPVEDIKAALNRAVLLRLVYVAYLATAMPYIIGRRAAGELFHFSMLVDFVLLKWAAFAYGFLVVAIALHIFFTNLNKYIREYGDPN